MATNVALSNTNLLSTGVGNIPLNGNTNKELNEYINTTKGLLGFAPNNLKENLNKSKNSRIPNMYQTIM